MKLKFKLILTESLDGYCWNCQFLEHHDSTISFYCNRLHDYLIYYDGPIAGCYNKFQEKKL